MFSAPIVVAVVSLLGMIAVIYSPWVYASMDKAFFLVMATFFLCVFSVGFAVGAYVHLIFG